MRESACGRGGQRSASRRAWERRGACGRVFEGGVRHGTGRGTARGSRTMLSGEGVVWSGPGGCIAGGSRAGVWIAGNIRWQRWQRCRVAERAAGRCVGVELARWVGSASVALLLPGLTCRSQDVWAAAANRQSEAQPSHPSADPARALQCWTLFSRAPPFTVSWSAVYHDTLPVTRARPPRSACGETAPTCTPPPCSQHPGHFR